MSEQEVEALLRRGELDQAAALARRVGMYRRAAELLALGGRHAEAVITAMEGNDWRQALELALRGTDDRLLQALCDELAKKPELAGPAAAQARIFQRVDVAARLLEPSSPGEAGQAWYETGEYLRASQCWDRAGDRAQAARALEQHLSQTPEDTSAAERLAEIRASRGDDEGAVRALQLAAKHDGGPSILKKLVDGLSRLGFDGSARAAARRLRAKDPTASVDPQDHVGALPRNEGHEKRYGGRYKVVRQVGSGATGRVLEAVDELTGDTVALKILSVGDDKGAAFARFMREAELAKVLDDPTLVRMRALDPEGPTIVYDWMPGGTLADRLQGTKIPVGEIRTIGLRLLQALENLHRNGIVHRDLKPSNVLFDPAGQARLGDLGAAHLSDLGATVTGGLVGSLPYMAPEQITGAPVSASTDLYAFGCLLFQMLTGRLPYEGPDFVSQHLSDPLPRVSGVRPALGLDYDGFLVQLLAKDPEQRPPQASDARRLFLAMPWIQPDQEDDRIDSLRPSSAPPAPGGGGMRLVPSMHEGRWSDTKLGRDVERIYLPAVLRETVVRWAGSSSSDLQAIFDIEDEGNELVALVEPVDGLPTRVDSLASPDRERISTVLTVLGIARERVGGVLVLRSPAFGTTVPVRVLMG